MAHDEFETRIMRGGLPPLADGNGEAEPPVRMPEPVRIPRVRPDSFRTSEAYLTAQLARAAARGRRTQ